MHRMRSLFKAFITWLRQRMSIRIAFTLPFFLQTILMTMIISYILFQASLTVTNQVLYLMNDKTLEQVDLKLQQELLKPINLNQINFNAYYNGILKPSDKAERERYFVSLLKGYENVAMTYMGFENGSFYGARRIGDGSIQVVVNDKGTGGSSVYFSISEIGEALNEIERFNNFDPRKRPWYLKAKTQGIPVFTDVYQHFVFKEPTITAARPVYQDSQLIGVMGVDYLLTWLESTLKSFPVGIHGKVYLKDQNDYLVGSSEGIPIFKTEADKIVRVKADEAADGLIAEADRQSKTIGHNKQYLIHYEGLEYIVSRSSFSDYDLGWSVYVITAKKDFLGPINDALLRTAVLLGLSVLLFFYVAYFMAKSVLRPILDLSDAADALAHGKSQLVDDRDRQDEVGQLIKNFNRMSLELTELVVNLESQVDLRTRELQEKNAILEQLSFMDGLTQIANRRKFDEFYIFSWQSASRNHQELIVLMLDIDHFKHYNDTYGHLEGDQCLKGIAQLLQIKVKRSSDLLARYGGEEFVIVLNHTTIDYAIQMSEDILQSVRELGIEHKSSAYGVVTLSIGVAVIRASEKLPMDYLIDLADQALYQAKSSGRNTYMVLG